jgi:hypothetical protein
MTNGSLSSSNGGSSGLVLPPMVNANKYNSNNSALGETSKIEKHHLPPAGDQASLERRFNP